MTDPTVENLVELPFRVVKQPTPEMHKGGDCGACVLAGLLGLTLEEVYAKLHRKGEPHHFGYETMCEALRRAYYDLKLIDRYITRTPHWPQWDAQRAWGDVSWTQQMEWREWLQLAFDAGYVALAQVKCIPEPMMFDTDHWVMYCGTRLKWDGPPGERKSGEYELLVSDSARSQPLEKWSIIGEHLKARGGFAVLLARPTTRP
jgi:hypothetical protein